MLDWLHAGARRYRSNRAVQRESGGRGGRRFDEGKTWPGAEVNSMRFKNVTPELQALVIPLHAAQRLEFGSYSLSTLTP